MDPGGVRVISAKDTIVYCDIEDTTRHLRSNSKGVALRTAATDEQTNKWSINQTPSNLATTFTAAQQAAPQFS
jgi:hypothetical protein